jgi:YHS domain-containing protein
LAAMTNLTRLHLERSGLSDTGLAALASLTQLEYLNLYGTAVTDAGLEALRSLPNLKQLYVWQTKVTSTGGQAFAESRIDKAQMQEWQEEIHKLQTRLRDARITVDRGTAVAAPAPAGTNASVTSTNAPAGAATPTASAGTPVNPACPVSGKPVNPAKTTLSDGRLIGFCCDDCKAEFLRDPKKFLAKLDAAVKPK